MYPWEVEVYFMEYMHPRLGTPEADSALLILIYFDIDGLLS